MADKIDTYDCTSGGSQHCYGCYTMEVCKSRYGDWVRKDVLRERAIACLDILTDPAQPHLAVRMNDACKFLDELIAELTDG